MLINPFRGHRTVQQAKLLPPAKSSLINIGLGLHDHFCPTDPRRESSRIPPPHGPDGNIQVGQQRGAGAAGVVHGDLPDPALAHWVSQERLTLRGSIGVPDIVPKTRPVCRQADPAAGRASSASARR